MEPDLFEETPEEKAFFETGGEAEPEPETQEAEPTTETVEQKAEPEPTTQEEPKEEKPEATVPYGALHEERMLRKEAMEELRRTREQVEQLQSLKEELQSIRSQKQSQEDQESFDDDPIGHLRKQQEELQKTLSQRDEEQRTQQTQMQEVQKLQATINTQVQEFVKEHGDYEQALQFVSERRMSDLAALGITDFAQQQQIINAEAWNIAQTALQNERNPAQVVYDLANSWGYKQPATQKTDLEEKVETIQKGQAESQTLSDAGGASESTGLSLADIETMSDEEFDKLWLTMENQN